jgi:hypothetical protein
LLLTGTYTDTQRIPTGTYEEHAVLNVYVGMYVAAPFFQGGLLPSFLQLKYLAQHAREFLKA